MPTITQGNPPAGAKLTKVTFKQNEEDQGQVLIDLGETSAHVEDVFNGRYFYDKYGQLTQGLQKTTIKDVNFYFPTGDLLYSYSWDEVEQEDWDLPDFPSEWRYSEELEFEKWNYTKEEILASYSRVDVGGLFVPTVNESMQTHWNNLKNQKPDLSSPEGRITKFFVDCEKTWSEVDRTVSLNIYLDNLSNFDSIVDWGDGTPSIQLSGGGISPHEYEEPGQYVISIYIDEKDDITATEKIAFGSSCMGPSLCSGPVVGASFGKNIDTLSGYDYLGCGELIGSPSYPHCLKFVTVTSQLKLFSDMLITECLSLAFFAVPSNIHMESVWGDSWNAVFAMNCPNLCTLSTPKLYYVGMDHYEHKNYPAYSDLLPIKCGIKYYKVVKADNFMFSQTDPYGGVRAPAQKHVYIDLTEAISETLLNGELPPLNCDDLPATLQNYNSTNLTILVRQELLSKFELQTNWSALGIFYQGVTSHDSNHQS